MSDVALTYLFLCASAFVAGAMNSIAGGGTLLTFPALTGFIPITFANATSTVALLPGSLAGSVGYRKELFAARHAAIRMIIPSLLGGFLGAWLVARDEKMFEQLVPWLILTATTLFLIQQPIVTWLKKSQPADTPPAKPGVLLELALMVFQFLIGVYGGYFGAGIGILMLTALGFMGVGDIHRMNAVKSILAVVINGASIVVFIGNDMVKWDYALAMAAAAIVGGYVGARGARRLRPCAAAAMVSQLMSPVNLRRPSTRSRTFSRPAIFASSVTSDPACTSVRVSVSMASSGSFFSIHHGDTEARRTARK